MSAVDREGRLGTSMTTKQILLNFMGFSEISLEMVGSGKDNPKSATVCMYFLLIYGVHTYSTTSFSLLMAIKTQLIMMTSMMNKLKLGWVRTNMAPLRNGLNGVSRNTALVELNRKMFLSFAITIKDCNMKTKSNMY